MGLTQNLGRLSPSIFTDSSLNVGIGAAPSGTYKLEVTGTAKVSGITSLTSATASTSTTTGGLIVTGGIGIGGALFGTSATFSGNVQVGGAAIGGNSSSFYNTAAETSVTIKQTSGATILALGLWNNSTTGDSRFLRFFSEATATFRGAIQYDRTGDRLGIYGSGSGLFFDGAATFSSSINSGAIQATASGAAIQLIGLASSNAYYVNDQTANSGKRWRFGHTGAIAGYSSFDFYNQTDGITALTLASTGAAIFSNTLEITSATSSSSLIQQWSYNSAPTQYNLKLNTLVSSGLVRYSFDLRNNNTDYTNTLVFNNGNIGIGEASPTAKLQVIGINATSANSSLLIQNSVGTTLFSVRNDGWLISPTTVNNTSATAANLGIDGSGNIFKSTASSIRYKENITDWNDNGLDIILTLKPKIFTYKANYYSNPERQFLGLIAEEVAEVSTYLADYENEDKSGEIESVRYATIVVPLIKAVQELSAQNQDLKSRLDKAGL